MADESLTLDQIIDQLEDALEEAEACFFTASADDPPKICLLERLSDGYIAMAERKPKRGELLRLSGGRIQVRLKDSVVKGQRMRVTIYMDKDGRGESICNGEGEVVSCRRMTGGFYDSILDLSALERSLLPAHQRFLDFAARADFAGWNRWCSDLEDGPCLRELDLQNLCLANFDLAAADLTGSDLSNADLSNCNLSGADLTACKMENVRLNGADLFRVRLPRRHMGLLAMAGLVEVESVLLAD